jgi:hypothetical protein
MFSRCVWQHGSRILSTSVCNPSLHEKAINLHEAVKEEIATAARKAGFRDVSDDDIQG